MKTKQHKTVAELAIKMLPMIESVYNKYPVKNITTSIADDIAVKAFESAMIMVRIKRNVLERNKGR